jgi:hypothetical protein
VCGCGLFMAAMLLSCAISDECEIDVGKYVPCGDSLGFYICATAPSILIAYAILCLFLGKTRTDGLAGNLFQKLFGCRRTRNSVINYSVRSMELPETREP